MFDSVRGPRYPWGMSDREVAVLAPAKVNLHLEVIRRRPDGFHDVLSLLQAVDLADEVRCRLGGADGGVVIEGSFDVPPARNTVCRAIEAFRRATGCNAGVEVRVEKRIPAGAGLGGGSSDAAATLRCMRALLHPGMPLRALAVTAAEVGSDVPFFLCSAAAIARGRGEVLQPVAARVDFALLAVVPPVSVSTALAYALLDSRPEEARRRLAARRLRLRYRRGPPEGWGFSNSFDPIVCEAFPPVASARAALRGVGAAEVRLTGSGSAVIGVFATAAAAEAAREILAAEGRAAAVLRPLAAIPPVW
jgi:4-diphosphocytidyl-2-C-methyl-D-erythritol kinase